MRRFWRAPFARSLTSGSNWVKLLGLCCSPVPILNSAARSRSRLKVRGLVLREELPHPFSLAVFFSHLFGHLPKSHETAVLGCIMSPSGGWVQNYIHGLERCQPGDCRWNECALANSGTMHQMVTFMFNIVHGPLQINKEIKYKEKHYLRHFSQSWLDVCLRSLWWVTWSVAWACGRLPVIINTPGIVDADGALQSQGYITALYWRLQVVSQYCTHVHSNAKSLCMYVPSSLFWKISISLHLSAEISLVLYWADFSRAPVGKSNLSLWISSL